MTCEIALRTVKSVALPDSSHAPRPVPLSIACGTILPGYLA
jgi:hypothetical protein